MELSAETIGEIADAVVDAIEHRGAAMQGLRLQIEERDGRLLEFFTKQCKQAKRIAELEAELDKHRCSDLDAFADGQLSAPRADAFRAHLATCPQCEAGLLGRVQEVAIIASGLERRDAVVAAAVAWASAGGPLVAIVDAVHAMEPARG